MQCELSGIIVVDKPTNITSAKVVAHVKKILGAGKVGHAGTLDPFATGVLICCINKATKLARFFLSGKKKYEAVLHLGVETDTQDSTGTVISTSDDTQFSEETIRSVFKQFEGTVEQLPPVYSALKHKGVPLYKLARKGKPLQKPARRIYISYIKILEIKLPMIRFEVSCSAGTYIRTICSDIGKTLTCGGHLKELRRTKSSGFAIKNAISLSELEKLVLSGKLSEGMINMANALQDMPEYIADNTLTKTIMHGKRISKKDLLSGQSESPKKFFKIVDTHNNLLAVLSYNKERNNYNYCCVFS